MLGVVVYAHHGSRVIAIGTQDANGTILWSHAFGHGPLGPVFARDLTGAGNDAFLFTDHLGTPFAYHNPVTDATTYTPYNPWGELLASQPLTGPPWAAEGQVTTSGFTLATDAVFPLPPFGIAGHLYDAETGLTQMHHRYYSPRLGHFLTPDYRAPDIYDPSTFTEPYAYAAGNPMMYWDPDGLEIVFNRDQISDIDLVELLYQLEQITGLELGIQRLFNDPKKYKIIIKGELVKKDESSPQFSSTAEQLLRFAISSKRRIDLIGMYEGVDVDGNSLDNVEFAANLPQRVLTGKFLTQSDGELFVDFNDFKFMNGNPFDPKPGNWVETDFYGLPEGFPSIKEVEKQKLEFSIGLGMVVLHEIGHLFPQKFDGRTWVFYKDDDIIPEKEWQFYRQDSWTDEDRNGPIVNRINIIRKELGLPLRSRYDLGHFKWSPPGWDSVENPQGFARVGYFLFEFSDGREAMVWWNRNRTMGGSRYGTARLKND